MLTKGRDIESDASYLKKRKIQKRGKKRKKIATCADRVTRSKRSLT